MNRLAIVSDDVPWDLSGRWRLDCGANKTAYERMGWDPRKAAAFHWPLACGQLYHELVHAWICGYVRTRVETFTSLSINVYSADIHTRHYRGSMLSV